MRIVIGSDKKGLGLKNIVLKYLMNKGFTIEDLTPKGDVDFYEASMKVVSIILEDPENNKGIIIDQFGVGPFMVADKYKYVICAELNDEHSAKMTRDHNNANVITMGSGILGDAVACNIAERFCRAEYSGGRHQIRVDMLNKMG